MKFFITINTQADIAINFQYGFQDPATLIMNQLIDFHNDLMFSLITIVFVVLWLLILSFYYYQESNTKTIRYRFTHRKRIEQIWTMLPATFLAAIAGPSFTLLYSADELNKPTVTLKVFGNQWYWSYEYSDYIEVIDNTSITFDSYMLQEDDLIEGWFRLLEVDNKVYLPINHVLRILVTSKDVIHSWAIPSLGVKIDACPGRLNQIGIKIYREGIFYGQCSELCGINHAFMPIVVESIRDLEYINWIQKQYNNN